MKALDIKLTRDLKRLWAQSLAVALVMACGVATLILAIGSYRSLDETRSAYYERYRFAHLFATATRAPRHLLRRIEQIPGVARADARVVEHVILDIPGMAEPASGLAVSLPRDLTGTLNRLYMRAGRLPEPDRPGEAVIGANFAKAHGFRAGSTLHAVVAGKRRRLTVVGLAMSPEFIYALGPGDLVPDDKRFGIIWMSETELEALADQKSSFNSLSIALLPGTNAEPVLAGIDETLKPYGGTGAYARKDQFSHAFLDGELTQLSAMARIIPPVFLLVSAFLINMILSRLIALEREQIGLMKALGYGSWTVAWHYLKLVMLIAIVGILIGFAAGTWLGQGMTRIYAQFFSFPFLIFAGGVDVYAISAGISIASAVAGAVKALWGVISLPPAVAMQPPAPPVYRGSFAARLGITRLFSQLTVMAIRYLSRWPVRSFVTTLGVSFAVALLVVAMFASGSINHMVETIFYQSDRQDATITFADAKGPDALLSVRQMPGVMRVEAFRTLSVRITHGQLSRRLAITGKPHDAALSRVLDLGLKPVRLPENGVAVSERVATLLELKPGDLVEVELLEAGRGKVQVPVTDVIQSYLGLVVFMRIEELNRLAGLGPRVSGAHISADASQIGALYDVIKSTPALSSIALQTKSREKFREIIEKNIMISTVVYTILAVIIAFGVVYNSARIQFSERARELASLRVLGFSRAEVSRVLLLEMLVMVVLAQPLGWAIGYGITWSVVEELASDQFRIPFVVERSTLAIASLIVLAAAALSALLVHRRVNRLDLIRALKTRE